MVHMVPYGPVCFPLNLLPLDFHSWGVPMYHSFFCKGSNKTFCLKYNEIYLCNSIKIFLSLFVLSYAVAPSWDVNRALYSGYKYCVQCAVPILHCPCSVFSMKCSILSLKCTPLCSVQWEKFSVLCAVSSVQFAVCSAEWSWGEVLTETLRVLVPICIEACKSLRVVGWHRVFPEWQPEYTLVGKATVHCIYLVETGLVIHPIGG